MVEVFALREEGGAGEDVGEVESSSSDSAVEEMSIASISSSSSSSLSDGSESEEGGRRVGPDFRRGAAPLDE